MPVHHGPSAVFKGDMSDQGDSNSGMDVIGKKAIEAEDAGYLKDCLCQPRLGQLIRIIRENRTEQNGINKGTLEIF